MTRNLSVFLALAGMEKERPMKQALVWAPFVTEADGESIVYHPGRYSKSTASRKLLREFLEIRNSSKRTIAFCRKWGALGLCVHGLPGGHECGETETFGLNQEFRKESISAIQAFAHALESLLRIGAEISQARPGRPEDWDLAEKVIAQDFGKSDGLPWRLAEKFPEIFHGNALVEAGRLQLQILMRRVIELAQVCPRFFWNPKTKSWQIDLDTARIAPNIPALLIIELMVTIADKDGFAICSSCHQSYIPMRKPDPTRNNYCPKCGTRASWRDAARKKRENDRRKRDE